MAQFIKKAVYAGALLQWDSTLIGARAHRHAEERVLLAFMCLASAMLIATSALCFVIAGTAAGVLVSLCTAIAVALVATMVAAAVNPNVELRCRKRWLRAAEYAGIDLRTVRG